MCNCNSIKLKSFFKEGEYTRVLTLPDGQALAEGKDVLTYLYKNKKFIGVQIDSTLKYQDGTERIYKNILNICGIFKQTDNLLRNVKGHWVYSFKTGIFCTTLKGVDGLGVPISGKYNAQKNGNDYTEQYYENINKKCTLFYNANITKI